MSQEKAMGEEHAAVSDFHELGCSMMASRSRLRAVGKPWPVVLAEQEPCDCVASMEARR